MTSIIKFTPLSGALNDGPNSYILQVDDFTFLLDCGWSESLDKTVTENIRKHIGQIDAVLLTFPDVQHIGSLPYLVGKLGLNCPIYATVPVYKMGQMFLYDFYQSRHNTEEFDEFTLDDVDIAFEKIIQIKHNQTVNLKFKGEGISITPVHAGHMIGGTAWRIVKDDEEGEIIYAVDFNHKRERHLNGCSLVETGDMLLSGRLPQLLITDAYNATYNQSRRKIRDEQLLTKIIETMRSDGNVLIAVDTAGRVLELAILLDQLWRDSRSGLCAYSLAMINNVTYNVVEFAKSMVEWMSDKIINSFADQRNNPFQFKHLKLCHNLGDLAQVPSPKCVLASTASLESGFSRQLFTRWCSEPKNAVILTSRTPKGTLARQLIDNPATSSLNLEIRKRVPIIGEELDQYERAKAAKKLEEKKLEAESSDESENEENIEPGKAQHDFLVQTDVPKKGGSFFKQAKKTFPMYPFIETRLKWDEYGEIINPEDYRIGEIIQLEDELINKNKKEKFVAEEMETEEAQEPVEETPTKCIKEQVVVQVNCSVSFIDFEGRSDGESMLKIVQQIKPMEVILIRGEPKDTYAFRDSILKTMANNNSNNAVKVFNPAVNEVVDTTKERHIYQVKIKDSLMGSLRFSSAKNADLCWLCARVDYSETVRDSAKVLSSENGDIEEENNPITKMEVDQAIGSKVSFELDDIDYKLAIPSLEPVNIEDTPVHEVSFINEVRLSDFKQVLVKEGIQAEFIGGVLVCKNTVAIRRNQQGLIDVEGCLNEDYYIIRDLLYKQYALV